MKDIELHEIRMLLINTQDSSNVILNDAGLQEDLNLNTPDNPNYKPEEGLDYWAVAKVGILTFADYIHDIYIADGGWREDTWNWIFDPGYTLVDLVDAALGAIGDAVNAVKTAAENFVDGVKTGLSFIGDKVRSAIVSGISISVNTLIKSILILITSLDDSLTYIDNQGIAGINTGNNHDIMIGSSPVGNNLQININEVTLQISDLISLDTSYETLAITEPGEIILITVITELLMIGSAFLSGKLIKNGQIGKGQLLFGGSLIATTIIEILSLINYANNDQSSGQKNSLFVFESILSFSLGQFLGTLTWLSKNDRNDHDIGKKLIDSSTDDFDRWLDALKHVGWKSDAVTLGKDISSFLYYTAIFISLGSIFSQSFEFSRESLGSNITFLMIGFIFGYLKSHLLASKAGSIIGAKADKLARLDMEDPLISARIQEQERDLKAINLVYLSMVQSLTMFLFSGIKIAQIRSN